MTNSTHQSPSQKSHTNPGLSIDRAAGVLLGCAAGDALGAGYEFQRTLPASIAMIGGGLGDFEPGEWTDDTTMAVSVAEAAAAGHDLRYAAGLDVIADGFARWYASGPKDIGISTSNVLSNAVAGGGTPTGQKLTDTAHANFAAGHLAAGNGALMRTAAVALAHLDDPHAAADAARAVSDLTHADPVSAEACLIWTLGIRHAVVHANFDGVRDSLNFLPADRAAYWTTRLDEAEAHVPAHFENNGWVVEALQAAWSAIARTDVPKLDPGAGTFPAQHLALATEAAVRAGWDTDTVAAIAGSLLGAQWGASALPLAWKRILHGWPGYRARDLVRLGVHAARLSLGLPADDGADWPGGRRVSYEAFSGTGAFAVHPHDPGVRLGGIDALHRLGDSTDAASGGVDAVVSEHKVGEHKVGGIDTLHRPSENADAVLDRVDAVVSLCRLGAEEVPAAEIAPENHVEVWLIDSNDPGSNPHLPYVIDQAAAIVTDLRAEGLTVLLHCVQAQSRTPSVASRYAVLARGLSPRRALDEVCATLPDASPQPALRDAVLALGVPPISDYAIRVDADPDNLGAALRGTEQIRDETLLAHPGIRQLSTELVAAFQECLTAPGMPWDGGGSLNAPDGGYVQWTRVDAVGSPLHLEVSNGGEYSEPLPHILASQLVDLGWQAPNEDFRNAWARAHTDKELAEATHLVIRTLSAALGVETSHLNWARLNS